MPIVWGAYVPNAPNLIAPEVFGGQGAATVAALRGLEVEGRHRPDAIVVASPHWSSPGPFLVQESPHPRQIFDFSGFPDALRVPYAPPGHPVLAARIVKEATRRGIPARATREWGLDHGSWAPLLHLLPSARVPVVPVSITARPPDDHLAFGEAIGAAAESSDLRIAVVGTGSIAHRLDRMDPSPAARWAEGERLEREVLDLVLARRYRDLARFDRRKWATLAPEGDLGPLFEAVGAVGTPFRPRLVAEGQAFGAAGLSVLEFARE